jgi:alpha-glucosidase
VLTIPSSPEFSASKPEIIDPEASEVDFWHSGPVMYEIYPRSFNSDGNSPEGTIRGITDRLSYLNELGVDGIWLTPFYKSPMVDGGYDITSYREVDPRFGDMEDVEALIEEAHNRKIKVMVDLVPNHMSTESAWYKESSASKDKDINSKSDWFIYRDAKPDGSLPNNWPSEFRKRTWNEETSEYDKELQSVWQYVPERDQYVLCSFTDRQADLNWENPEVREAMYDEMRFLLGLGVDGFRVDMVAHIGKDPDLTDEPANPSYDSACGDPNQALRTQNREHHPSLFKYMKEMVAVLKEYDNRFMVTEDYIGGEDAVAKYGEYYAVDPMHVAPFSFQGFDFMMPHTAKDNKEFYGKYLGSMGPDFVPTSVIGNHDQPRAATRLGREAARAAALMQFTLPGIPFIYYGEELGMEDVAIPPDKIDDPYDGRDPGRTPMLWTPGKNAGFTGGDVTWLPISPDFATRNVESQRTDPRSFLSLYKRLLRLRHDSPALKLGAYIPHDTEHEHVFGYSREYNEEERLMMLINFSGKVALARTASPSSIIVSSRADSLHKIRDIRNNVLPLKPFEGVVLKAD